MFSLETVQIATATATAMATTTLSPAPPQAFEEVWTESMVKRGKSEAGEGLDTRLRTSLARAIGKSRLVAHLAHPGATEGPEQAELP